MLTESNPNPTQDLNMKNEESTIQSFSFEGKEQPVSFVESMDVTDGVVCYVYAFVDDESRDLGVIKIDPGKKTPLQKVLKGDRTIEGYMAGKGKLTITKTNGRREVYDTERQSEKPLAVLVNIGEMMQWEADGDSSLQVYEVCFPPYEDGRFEDMK